MKRKSQTGRTSKKILRFKHKVSNTYSLNMTLAEFQLVLHFLKNLICLFTDSAD